MFRFCGSQGKILNPSNNFSHQSSAFPILKYKNFAGGANADGIYLAYRLSIVALRSQQVDV